MRGQYAHNTGVWFNSDGPNGGWQGYKNHGYEHDNIATHLNADGYRTGLFGKYFNSYDGTTASPRAGTIGSASSARAYFNYYVNDNGTKSTSARARATISPTCSASGDPRVHRRQRRRGRAILRLRRAQSPARTGHPGPAPRATPTTARRPRASPSFNEGDVSDKPPWIRSLPRLSDHPDRADRHPPRKAGQDLASGRRPGGGGGEQAR